MTFLQKEHYSIEDLKLIMTILRSEDGCPWDKEQTHQTIRKNFIEETYEAIEAIDNNDAELLKEELGDVLLQVIFHAQIEDERNSFTFDDVINGICNKLVVRHPHVFAGVAAADSKQAFTHWNAIKLQQKGQTTCVETLLAVPKQLPSLMRTAKVQERAAKCGIGCGTAETAINDLQGAVDILKAAVSHKETCSVEAVFGELLFAAVNASRLLGFDAEELLYRSCDRFIEQIAAMEERAQC